MTLRPPIASEPLILPDMGRRRGQQRGYLYQEDDCWKARWYVDDIDASGKPTRKRSKPWVIGRSHGPGKLSKKQAQRILAEKMIEVNRGGNVHAAEKRGGCDCGWAHGAGIGDRELTRSLWVSAHMGAGSVTVDEQDKITAICPLWRKFKGQQIQRLLGWIEKVEHERPLVSALGGIIAPPE